jgi:uncharacterized membrane protein YhiD involved in acid resistance
MEIIEQSLRSLILEEFTAISLIDLIITFFLSLILGVIIAIIYRFTYSGVLFNSQFALGLVLLSMITAVIILAISANLVLSLGMVGALSIVRFRTAVKDPMDTVYMFWALATGILAGAGFILIAALATALIGIAMIVLTMIIKRRGKKRSFLLVIRYIRGSSSDILRVLKIAQDYRIKSKSSEKDFDEFVIEAQLSNRQLNVVEELRAIGGVIGVNLVSCENDGLIT